MGITSNKQIISSNMSANFFCDGTMRRREEKEEEEREKWDLLITIREFDETEKRIVRAGIGGDGDESFEDFGEKGTRIGLADDTINDGRIVNLSRGKELQLMRKIKVSCLTRRSKQTQ